MLAWTYFFYNFVKFPDTEKEVGEATRAMFSTGRTQRLLTHIGTPNYKRVSDSAAYVFIRPKAAILLSSLNTATILAQTPPTHGPLQGYCSDAEKSDNDVTQLMCHVKTWCYLCMIVPWHRRCL